MANSAVGTSSAHAGAGMHQGVLDAEGDAKWQLVMARYKSLLGVPEARTCRLVRAAMCLAKMDDKCLLNMIRMMHGIDVDPSILVDNAQELFAVEECSDDDFREFARRGHTASAESSVSVLTTRSNDSALVTIRYVGVMPEDVHVVAFTFATRAIYLRYKIVDGTVIIWSGVTTTLDDKFIIQIHEDRLVVRYKDTPYHVQLHSKSQLDTVAPGSPAIPAVAYDEIVTVLKDVTTPEDLECLIKCAPIIVRG